MEAKGWTSSLAPRVKVKVEEECRKDYMDNSSRHSSLPIAIRCSVGNDPQSVKFQLYTSRYVSLVYVGLPLDTEEIIFRKEWGGAAEKGGVKRIQTRSRKGTLCQ